MPVWADFMKAATAKDKAVWLKAPDGVVAVDICRMSGRRPAEGCSHVDVVSKTGDTVSKSMVMTEYFAKGTEPYDECPIHNGPGLLARIGGIFGAGTTPNAVRESASPLPEHTAPPVAASGSTQVPAAGANVQPVEEPKKKKGFWSRIFGSRKSTEERDERPKP